MELMLHTIASDAVYACRQCVFAHAERATTHIQLLGAHVISERLATSDGCVSVATATVEGRSDARVFKSIVCAPPPRRCG
eukprot:3490306-Alexandrium_andersonii.AAC.1